MPEELQNPSKMKGTAKILSLLQELFSLPVFGRSETGYINISTSGSAIAAGSSKAFMLLGQVPHGAPEISSPVMRKGTGTAVLTTAPPELSH